MGSHQDTDHTAEILKELKYKAEVMTSLQKNRIAAEKPIRAWSHDKIRVEHLPDDEHGVLRISIGGHPDFTRSEYCNFRGDQSRCIKLLERCLKALKQK